MSRAIAYVISLRVASSLFLTLPTGTAVVANSDPINAEQPHVLKVCCKINYHFLIFRVIVSVATKRSSRHLDKFASTQTIQVLSGPLPSRQAVRQSSKFVSLLFFTRQQPQLACVNSIHVVAVKSTQTDPLSLLRVHHPYAGRHSSPIGGGTEAIETE